jgi:hypothetical protein
MTSRILVLAGFVLALAAPARSDGLEALKGKFAFDWHSDPAKAKCVKVDDALLSDFKSSKYKCDLKPKSDTSAGVATQTCTQVKGGKEYLIFARQKDCDDERETQAANE